MVNGRGKSGKKRRNATNSSKTEKRGVSFESDALQEGVPAVTSLPPAVDGHLRCFLRVSVPRIHWKIPDYPKDVQVRLKWWGEDGRGVLFRPLDDKAYATATRSSKLASTQYPVCSGPKQFNAYLRDMGPLIFEVVCGPSLMTLGHARLDDAAKLSANAPIDGLFDVISSTSPAKKLADLYISLRFESTSAVYSQLLSSVPTVDLDIDSQSRATDTSDGDPAPFAPLNPATPITYPTQRSKDDDSFVSPANHTKGVKFAVGLPKRLEYTANHSLMPSPTTAEKPRGSDLIEIKDSSAVTSPRITADNVLSTTHVTDVSSDLIGTLLHRGERLREAMVMSTEDESSNIEEPAEHKMWSSDVVDTKRSSEGGKLFTELLASQESYKLLSSKDDSMATDSIIIHENKAVDLIFGEEEVHYMGESPVSSQDGSMISDTGDPLYDESLLKDLFYTTKAQQDSVSEDTISSDEEQNVTAVHKLEEFEKKGPLESTEKNLLLDTHVKRGSDRLVEVISSANKEESSGEATSLGRLETDPANVSRCASNSSIMSMPEETGGLEQKDFIENLGPEKLTALGRADTARVMVDSLMIGGNRSLGTFFIEYDFPTSTSTHNQEVGCAVATEVIRIASKKVQGEAVLFNHRSVFPVFFNAAVTDQWWRLALTFRIYHRDTGQRMPSVIGVATLPLKTVLQSDTLSSSASLQIKSHPQSLLPQDCLLSYSDKTAIGPLLVKVELVKDGKPLYLKPSFYKKPPLPSTTTAAAKKINVAEIQSVLPPVKLPKKILENKTEDTDVSSNTGDTLTLFTLLWIPEAKGVLQQDSHRIVTKSNLYLTCRMFWCEEVSKSRVVWGASSPQFGFKQVAPVLLTPTLLQRACNNFMVVEIWNRVGSPDDVLVGLVKLPLHQLYLSYRDPKITRTILKSKYPVVAVDGWSAITNPYTSSQHGHIRVLLTMGSLEQTSAILALKCGGEIPVELETRPGHHLDVERDTGKRNGFNSSPHQGCVEHQFQIEVEDIRGLSIFGSTVWGETDCFVQYHFPAQRHDLDDTDSEAIPSLTVHRTPATLCVPDPVFHDVAKHTFILPQDSPVQKHLQAAFTGSWVTTSSVPGSGGIPFELWRRYYYPNIRDQMVAKACLPLAKLCAMVTMRKYSEANIQTFSLPLKVLPGDAVDSLRHERIQDTGLIDISVKYQQIKKKQLLQGSSKHNEEGKHVCVCLQIFRACGLKAAALLHAKFNQSLSYAAEVGVNAYLVLHVPLGSKHEHVTRTVARTFSPEFSYQADMLLPMVAPSEISHQGKLSIAEELETSQMKFEIWHQVCKGVRSSTSGEMRSRRKQDVLLGVGRVSLSKLLTSRTGIKGWYAIYMPSDRAIEDDATSQCQMADGNIKDIVGGLELSINFSEAENRDAVIHIARGVGWAPPPAVDRDEDWLDEGQLSPNIAKLEFCLNINKAWIPFSELHSFSKGEKEAEKRTMLYARYKFYDRAPICTKLSPIQEVEEGIQICELKHFKGVVLAASTSLRWYMKEECLEIQLWFSSMDNNTAKKDRLLGTAYMSMSALTGSQKDKHISGLFPLFRAGASDLFGACVHLQASLGCCSTELAHNSAHEAQHTEGHFLSDEFLETDVLSESHAVMPSQEQEQNSEQCSTEERPVIEDDTDTFNAHIIIDQALRLPVLSGSKDERLLPNVYVSYQTLPSVPPSFTKTVLASTSPSWGYQKLERIPYKSLKTQVLLS